MAKQLEKIMKLIGFYFSIFVLLSSCSGIRPLTHASEARRRLSHADELYVQKQFVLAAQENLSIVKEFPEDSWSAKALYNLGLIYTDPENPNKNYAKALEHFGMVYNQHPKVPLAHESKNWMAILVILRAQEIELDRLGRTIHNYESRISRLEEVIQQRDKLIGRIENKIEKYKQIDIELEEKERAWKK